MSVSTTFVQMVTYFQNIINNYLRISLCFLCLFSNKLVFLYLSLPVIIFRVEKNSSVCRPDPYVSGCLILNKKNDKKYIFQCILFCRSLLSMAPSVLCKTDIYFYQLLLRYHNYDYKSSIFFVNLLTFYKHFTQSIFITKKECRKFIPSWILLHPFFVILLFYFISAILLSAVFSVSLHISSLNKSPQTVRLNTL